MSENNIKDDFYPDDEQIRKMLPRKSDPFHHNYMVILSSHSENWGNLAIFCNVYEVFNSLPSVI